MSIFVPISSDVMAQLSAVRLPIGSDVIVVSFRKAGMNALPASVVYSEQLLTDTSQNAPQRVRSHILSWATDGNDSRQAL